VATVSPSPLPELVTYFQLPSYQLNGYDVTDRRCLVHSEVQAVLCLSRSNAIRAVTRAIERFNLVVSFPSLMSVLCLYVAYT
jgi:hypothetical protein